MNHVELQLPQLDSLAQGIAGLKQQMIELARTVEKLSDPRPEWETLPAAMRRRGKARRTILAAVSDGRIRHRRQQDRGAEPTYYLSIADLDEHFPVAEKA